MRLSAIHLHGFKSFRDATRIFLAANPVVIVGPNGCGKSNIVDAVRWVLGESSARQLRGSSLGDVISNGGTGRSPADHAAVDLIFDNGQGQAPAPWTATAEIRVRRSLQRDGDSQYRINDARCRKRDVGDLFLGTGLGASPYAIIEQGMIGRIVEGRPEELRALLEEAGGISRYKERRRETLQRITETREHLSRLKDIHGEMETRSARLQDQAAAARKLRVLRLEERQWQWWGLGQKIALLDAEHGAVQEERETRAKRLQEVQSAVSGLEDQVSRLREALGGHQKAVSLAQETAYALQAEHSRLEQVWQHAQAERTRLAGQLDLEHGRSVRLEQEAEARRSLTEERQKQGLRLQADQENVEREISVLRHERDRTEKDLAASESRHRDAQQRLNEWRRGADVRHAQWNEIIPRIEALEKRRQRLAADTGSSVPEMRIQEGLVEQLRQQTGAELVALQGLQGQFQERQQILQQSRERFQGLRQQHQGLRTRSEALERLRRGLERSCSSGEGERLSRNMAVVPGWEWAVERALGDRLHAVMATHERPAPAEGGGGYWLFPGGREPEPEAVPADALVHRISAGSGLWEPLSHWLWGVRCVQDLQEALQRTGELGAGESWITPAGERVYPLALERPGTDAESGSLLQCQKELEFLAGELAAVAVAAESAQKSLQAEESHVRVLGEQCQERERSVRDAERRLGREKESLARLSSRVEEETRRLQEACQERERVETELAQLEERRQDLDSAKKRDTAQENVLRESEREAGAAYQQIQKRLGDLRGSLARLRDRQQRQALELQRIGSEDQAARERLEELARAREETLERLHQARQALDFQDLQMPDLEKQRADLRERRERAGTHLRGLQQAWDMDQIRIREADGLRSQREQERRQLEHEEASAQLRQATLEARRQEWETRALELVRQLPCDPGPLPDGKDPHRELQRIQNAVERLGNVNLAAEEELQELENRRGSLLAQVDDVESALASLGNAMASMDTETATRFRETLRLVNGSLREHFSVLFGGGEAVLQPSGDDPLEAGLVLRVQPPGKRNTALQQLSGGEKALAAIALVFALFQLNPAPFCVLDEVDAPLDDANVGRFCALLRQLAQRTQFLLVSHRHLTLQVAEQLVGVTMPEPGVSRVVPVTVAETLLAAAGRAERNQAGA